MDADNSFYVKFIATEAPTFFWYIISVLAMSLKLILLAGVGNVLGVAKQTPMGAIFETLGIEPEYLD